MISCVTLERPGKWRAISVTMLLLVAALPATPLLWRATMSMDSMTASSGAAVGSAFSSALRNSVVVAVLVAAVSLVVGLPAGVLTALYEFPGRRTLLALTALPLLVPSFLWAIGWFALAARFGPDAARLLSGFAGCIFVFSAGAVALVLLVSSAAAAALSGSQVDAARLAGGERTVLVQVFRHVATPALLAAGLGGVLTFSDPGPGQIFGLRTAAAEILTSFAALYDFSLAGQQCAVLTGLVLLLAVPLACFAAPRLASEMMARQSQAMRRVRHHRIAGATAAVLTLLVLTGTVIPVVGLALPLVGTAVAVQGQRSAVVTPSVVSLQRLKSLLQTFGDTLIYAAGAGAIAAALGLLLALCVGRNDRLRIACLGMCLALFSLPPALTALGFVQTATEAPAWADSLLRSRLTVCVALGVRFLPVAAVLGLRAWGSTSASWTLAAALHGVSLRTYLWRVELPVLLPAEAVAILLVALLATADVSTVLLLHPPGARSLPLAIFTVMANAPESLVATLCLVYVAVAAGLLTAVWTMAGRGKA